MNFQKRDRDQLAPPYSGYNMHLAVLTRLRQHGIPADLRASELIKGPLGKDTYYQLIRAWRYLGLANDNGEPEDILHQLVNSDGEEYQRLLKGILLSSYRFVFGPHVVPINMERATDEELVRRFAEQGISALTVRRCVSFLVRMARDAGLPLSEELAGEQDEMNQQSPARRVSNGVPGLDAAQDGTTGASLGSITAQNGSSAGASPMPKLPDLPAFNQEWSIMAQEKWLDLYDRVLSRSDRDKKPEA